MERLTYRDEFGRAHLTLYGKRIYCSMQATADCFCKLEEDLAAIKAPKVMTLDEVRNAYENPMWFESRGTFRGQKGFWVLSKGVSPSFVIRLIPAIGEDDTQLSLSAYGIVWRCWTSKPTDQQILEVKWDET